MQRSNIPLNTSRSLAARANVAASAPRHAARQGYAGGGSSRGAHQYDRTRSSPERKELKADKDDGEKSSGRCTPIPRGAALEPFEYPSNPEGTMTTIQFQSSGSASYRVLTARNGSLPSSMIPNPSSGAAFVGGRVVRPSSSVRGPGGAKPHRFVIATSSPPVPPSLAARRRRQQQQPHKSCAKVRHRLYDPKRVIHVT